MINTTIAVVVVSVIIMIIITIMHYFSATIYRRSINR